MNATKATTYTVTIINLGTGARRATTMRSPAEETPRELYTRAVAKLYGRSHGFNPDLPGHPNIGQVTSPGTGANRGSTILHGRVRIDTEVA